MKRSRHPSSSEEDSDNGSNSTSWSQHSQPRRTNWKKPSEVFRTDFITAMKLHDTYHLNPEDYYVLVDPWRQEWEKGVQVPVSPHTIPQPVARVVAEQGMEVMFSTPKKWIRSGCSGALGYVDVQTLAEGACRYDLNDTDVAWLELINHHFTLMGMVLLDEMTMERAMEEFERRCYDRMSHAMATEEGLGMEYDEDVVCDVCRSPDSEDNNEMVFCDKCNICVHQACYGILKVPKGSWLCRTCDLGILPKCQLCPKKGGAMKPTRSGTKWVHVSCALWIPEVSIRNPEKMEPITNMSHIPSNRWALTCCLCKDQTGACIQCSAKSCRTAFHVSCALQSSLEMNTILTEQDEVKFKSFCPKHSGLKGGQDGEGEEGARDKKWRKSDRVRGDEGPPLVPAPQEESRVNQQAVNLRQIKLQQLEEEFYQFVDVKEVANHLQLPPETVDFLYQYWKLKRRANHSQPLLTPQKEEEESLARREHDVLLHRLQLFTHLRQDLERVRNLTYMVSRREKIKRTLWRIQEQIFTHQAELLDHEIINGCLNDSARLSVVSAPVAVLGYSGLKTQRRDRRGGLHLLHSLTDGGSRHVRGQTDNNSRGQTDNNSRGQTDNNSSKLKTESRESSRPRIEGSRSLRKEAPEPEQQKSNRRKRGEDQGSEERTEDQETERRKRRREEDQGRVERRRRRRRGEVDHGTERRRGLKETSPIKAKTRLGSKAGEKLASRVSDMTDAKPANRMSEARVRLTRIKVHNVTEARVRLTRVRVSDHVTEVKERKVRLSGTDSQSDPRDTAVSMTTKHNGWPASSHLKNWGKFRIPKRSERPKEEPSNSTQRRPRLRTESDGYSSETPPSGLDMKACLKRCHAHQLRGGAYGSDIIHQGVLAS